IYIDAGHSAWRTSSEIVGALTKAGISSANGFSTNISNFRLLSDEIAYDNAIANSLGAGKKFIIDTSRNGKGPSPSYEWCNPSGRALGPRPTMDTGYSMADAFFWI